jgi:hypothetical protein
MYPPKTIQTGVMWVMRQLHVLIPEELDDEFRRAVGRKYGSKKGTLGVAVAEALQMWLEKNGGVKIKED